MVTYLPFDERTPDGQYRALLQLIYDHGVYMPTRQGARAKTVLGHTMHFDFKNGFPIINDRSLGRFWTKGIDELGAFINGARTLKEMVAVGCDWWEPWLNEAKTLKHGNTAGDGGGGFYGPAFHNHPGPDGLPFDQFAALMEQLELFPYDRRHHINPWIPELVMRSRANPQSGVTIAPCHGWIDVTIMNDGLYLEMMQRSGDVPVGVPSNMVQYAALTMFIAHLLGREPVQYIHHLRNAHVYEDQEAKTWAMLVREPLPLATMQLSPEGLSATDIHQFSSRMFELADYHPHPSIPGIKVST